MVTRICIILVHRTQRSKREGRSVRTLSSSAAPALPKRDVAPTVGPDIGAEVGQVMFLQDARSHAAHVQHMTDDQRATCQRRTEVAFGTLQLQTRTQLWLGASRLRRSKSYPWPVYGAPGHTRST